MTKLYCVSAEDEYTGEVVAYSSITQDAKAALDECFYATGENNCLEYCLWECTEGEEGDNPYDVDSSSLLFISTLNSNF